MSKRRKNRGQIVRPPDVSPRACLILAIFLIAAGLYSSPLGFILLLLGTGIYGLAAVDIIQGRK